MGIGYWEFSFLPSALGLGHCAQSPIPNPQSPIPNPQIFIWIKNLKGKNAKRPIELKKLSEQIEKFNPGKISSKSFGIIVSYAVFTNQGIVRNYNEDRE